MLVSEYQFHFRWSAKNGECPAGDPDLHHYVGDLLYKGLWTIACAILFR